MIWFILALTLPLAVALLLYGFRAWDVVDDWGEVFGFWGIGAFFGTLIALVVNLVLGFALEDKVHDQTYDLARTPEIVASVTDTGSSSGYVIQAVTADRQVLVDDGSDTKFIDSNDNTVTLRDYVVFNGWLSVMNFNNDELIFHIPESTKVVLAN